MRLVSVRESDAYDSALVTSVNGANLTASSIGGVITDGVGQSLTGTGSTTITGLSFTKTFTAFASQPILRTLLTFQNTTGSTLTFNFLLQNNVGSDAGTQVIGTSSGDATFATADNWIITDDSNVSGDPTNTHVLYALGNGGALIPDTVGLTVFEGAGTQGVLAQFNGFSMTAGETASFLFFNRLDTTSANAQAFAPNFASGASIQQAGLLAGLSDGQVSTVRNFAITGGAANAPEPGSLGLLGLGVTTFAGSGVLRRRKRKAN